ncbi:MAG: hypothetical protein U9P50_00935 [Patescibacteria group bacterium]|nr:hypothetical protein [Patescibacteria group bacterium]
MIKILRLIIFIPTMYLGALLAVVVNAIWNIPLTFLEWFVNLFGDWHLWGIFGKSSVSSFEAVYIFSSGLFIATIGLFLALAVFPYPKYRNRIIYVLGTLLFLGFITPTQIAIYEGSITLFVSKIVGLMLGFLFVLSFTKKTSKQNPINFIDNKLEIEKIKEKSNQQKASQGFIQIPILIFSLVSILVVSTGGYFTVKKIGQSKEFLNNGNQEKKELNLDEYLLTDDITEELVLDKEKVEIKEVAEKISQSDINSNKISQEENQQTQKINDFNQTLLSIKNEIESLNEAGLEVKTKIVKSETELSDLRIEKLKKLSDLYSIDIITETYNELIAIEEIREKNLSFVLSNSLIGILTYSWEVDSIVSSLKKKDYDNGLYNAEKLINAHFVYFDNLKKELEADIEMSIADNKAYGQEFLLRFESTNSIAERYSATLSALEDIESIRNEIENILSETPSYQIYSNTISEFLTQDQVVIKSSNCINPVNKYILVPQEGWKAVKKCSNGEYIEADKYKPDTSNMTPKQICDMRKASWFGGGALINTVDCSDLGL